MRKNRISRKWVTVTLVFIMLLISLQAFNSNSLKINEKRLLNEIKQNVGNKEHLNLDLINKVCSGIEMKQSKEHVITAEEYYFLAYKCMIDKDEFGLKNNLLSAYNLINDKTDVFVKINIYSKISSEFKDEVSDEEQADNFKNTFASITTKEMNENVNVIKKYINIMSSEIYDKKIVLDTLNDICSSSDKLDSNLRYYVRDALAVLNGTYGNYAKSIEFALKSLWENQNNPEPYFEARALVNAGMVYYELNDYNTAIEYMKRSLNVKIEDNEKNTHAKLYGLINMYLIYYDNEDYDSMFNNFSYIQNYINDDSASIFKIYEQIAYARYYLKINDLDKAEEHIKSTDDLYKIYGRDGFNDCDLHNYINIAELNYKRGNTAEAIRIYEQLLIEYKDRYNQKKRILDNISNIYKELEDCENSIKYLDMLAGAYKNETVMINANYSDNLIEMREKENEMNEINAKRNKSKVIILFLSVITALIILHFYITNMKLKKINKIDGLTQIYNRKYFNEIYESILHEKTNFNIIIFDIDDFKFINDTYGHVIGDKIIAGTASNVGKILGKKDKFFRYGGEEFVVINYDNNKKEISDLCEKIRRTVEMQEWQISIGVTVSIGACSVKDGGNNVLEYADECLYESKNTGKNKYTVK